jgi:hypothetical protein
MSKNQPKEEKKKAFPQLLIFNLIPSEGYNSENKTKKLN